MLSVRDTLRTRKHDADQKCWHSLPPLNPFIVEFCLRNIVSKKNLIGHEHRARMKVTGREGRGRGKGMKRGASKGGNTCVCGCAGVGEWVRARVCVCVCV